MSRNTSVNRELAASLAPFANVPAIMSGVTAAVGADDPTWFDASDTFPIVGFFLRPNPQVFSVYLVTPGRFILFELTPSGDSLTVTVPLSRVRRVVETVLTGRRQLVVEVAADRSVLQLEAGSTGLDGTGQAVTATQGVIRPSGYEINANDESEDAAIARFARALRRSCGL